MEHSDELTFADYFNAEKEIYRNITCAALAARWLIDHDFECRLTPKLKSWWQRQTAKCWKHGARFTRLPC